METHAMKARNCHIQMMFVIYDEHGNAIDHAWSHCRAIAADILFARHPHLHTVRRTR